MNNNEQTRIHPDLIEIALDKAEGFVFEDFSSDFLASVEGRNFMPLGGVHDGGADGLSSRGLFETDKQSVFYQVSIQQDHRAKIKKTLDRLKEFGRETRVLVYVTSKQIPHIDDEEDDLTQKHDVIIKIRDKRYITSHINDSIGTIAAYKNHLDKYTDFLGKIGVDRTTSGKQHVDDPSVYVFLQNEVANRLGNRKLIHSITDTLILWSLRETNPDTENFETRDDIYQKIVDYFPWSSSFIKAHLDSRLMELRAKSVNNREVRWYRKENKYCLPHETREAIKFENTTDEALKVEFIDELKLKSSEIFDADDGEYNNVALLSLNVIQKVFEKQGLLLSNFIIDDEEKDIPLVITDCIEEVLSDGSTPSEKVSLYRGYIEIIITSIFYNSSPTQREYLHHLARTYILLFTLKAEPRIVEYFSSMGAEFRLFVGSDILVKAISERYLNEEDKLVTNMLKLAAEGGMNLMISDSVLEEVYTHLRNTNFEFLNHFSEIEPYITRSIARNSEKILIRAYFYAKEKKQISGWHAYISQYISYNNINSSSGREELKKYLVSEYNLKFIRNEELEEVVDTDKVDALAKEIFDSDDKKNMQLAKNSALLVHGIYGLRNKYNEANNGSPFGHNTWWLSSQTRIQKHTFDLVRKNFAKYIIRPEFILNFLSISPSCDQVRTTYKNIFPSNLGIQLGHRLKENVFHGVLDKVKDWKNHQPGRVNTLVSDLSDKLKSDQFKIYDEKLEDIIDKVVDEV